MHLEALEQEIKARIRNIPDFPKPGKLPWTTIREEFELEYGKDAFEVHTDAITENDNVLIFDDVLATGGTARAAGNLVHGLGGSIAGYAFLIELECLKGREKIRVHATDISTLVKYS